jgi:hypothetical protein
MFIFHLPVINTIDRRDYIRSERGDKDQVGFFSQAASIKAKRPKKPIIT